MRPYLPYVIEALAVVLLFAALGAGCGWLWFQVWDPPTGTVVDGVWYPDGEEALGRVFDGTAWYVVLGGAAGLLGGAVAALAGRRSPLVTLGAVVVGSVLAAWLMYRIGVHLGPPDPQSIAKTASDGTRLEGNLTFEGGKSPYLVWPIGSLIALMTLNFVLSSRAEIKVREAPDSRWLPRNRTG